MDFWNWLISANSGLRATGVGSSPAARISTASASWLSGRRIRRPMKYMTVTTSTAPAAKQRARVPATW